MALVWLDPDTGIKCKIKIDWWHDAHTLADVKSAEDVTFEGFRRSCAQARLRAVRGDVLRGRLPADRRGT